MYLIDVARLYIETQEKPYLEFIQNIIKDWWKHNPFGTKNYFKDNWSSYTISLRTIAWIKVFLFIKNSLDNDFKEKFVNSLYIQLNYLSTHLELDIRGNHLLENGFGLLFGAYFLNDEKLYKTAKKILIPELKEQILPDGAHFELSPMYHQLMLYRVLDCYNLVKKNNHFDQELLSFFKEKAELMLGWLEQMTFKNGDIPLLNDSAFNINPTTQELIEYANRLGLQPKKKELNESGYRKIIQKNYELIADIGHIGPDYIPGHAHSDTLSFVLYVKNLPFIIDTGISTYNPTERRQIERSTSSHNTVQVGDYDQSEVWSSFRVARRAYPNILQDTNEIIEADLDYATISANHKRKFQCLEGEIIIKDEVKANHLAKAYLHFHPDVQVTLNKNIVLTNLGQVIVENATKIEIENYQYAPEFNKLIPAKRVIITFSKQIKTIIQI
jgi:uncharacterized heparinase superfamily protein